jgi:Tol biopolymer transport system component
MRIRALFTLTALALVGLATPAGATFKGHDGRYAFDVVEGFPSVQSVYVARSDGTGTKRVLRNAQAMGWSRDGTWILMIRRTSTLDSLWMARWNGTGLKRLPLPASIARNLIDYAAWAPDGRHIAFSFAQNGRSVIYTVRTDGKELKRIAVDADWPTWSGGGLIGFRQMKKNDNYLSRGLAVMRANGTHVTVVTRGGVARPSFSPDGKRLLFSREGARAWNPAVVTVATRRVSMIKLPPAYDPLGYDTSPLPLIGPEWAPSGKMFYSYQYDDLPNWITHTVVMGLSSNGTSAHRLFEITHHNPGSSWSTYFFYQGTHN